ncbi:NAD(P)H dehydrogenase (quinone) [Saccharothrix coeruleofusca]|uniref:SDR family oxidoreductase n=1 Tax=Saccharothrix coeruleofusca TaxID=33919 RepID=UPI001AEA44E3|nr:SDR family oxidoreductase [Saccharothrix coeruleofusca]MBP2340606.1 NAD(P)H dehydrogenase (quinone) [Saccharothrix coeruleofusca]
MTTLITGATGHLGSLIVEHVLNRIPAAELAVSVRDPEKASALAARGVDVRHGDFTRPETLRTAFAGVDKLVLVSIDGPDEERVEAHRAAVAAAKEAGVSFIAYTSVTDADTSPLILAKVHKATEEAISATGIPHAFLRNGMYHENYTPALAQGALVHAAGDGRIASASRDDLAEAAAVVITSDGHDNATYELTGPTAWSFAELAELGGVEHRAITPQERQAQLASFGLPEFLAELLADIEANIAKGVLSEVRPDLEKLLGRTPRSIQQAL